jgi:hypothetical protein
MGCRGEADGRVGLSRTKPANGNCISRGIHGIGGMTRNATWRRVGSGVAYQLLSLLDSCSGGADLASRAAVQEATT